MKLNAEDRFALVRDGHDDVVVRLGVDHEIARQRIAIDDERVITRSAHRRFASFEETRAAMRDRRDFSMDRNVAAHDARAECFADRLMSEADAEEWDGVVG